MAKEAIPLQGMYELINPDPLREFSVRAIAEAAGVGKSTVQRLRAESGFQVSKPIAEAVAKAVGMAMPKLFRPTGRQTWR